VLRPRKRQLLNTDSIVETFAGLSEPEREALISGPSARQQEAAAPEPPTGPGATASSDPNPGADQKDPDQMQNAEISSDPVTSEPDAAPPAIRSVTSWVQLGAFKNPENASTVWLNLRRTQSDLLSDLHLALGQLVGADLLDQGRVH
jgi:cell division septation protein DedD